MSSTRPFERSVPEVSEMNRKFCVSLKQSKRRAQFRIAFYVAQISSVVSPEVMTPVPKFNAPAPCPLPDKTS